MKNAFINNSDYRIKSDRYTLIKTSAGSYLGSVTQTGVSKFLGVDYGKAGRWEKAEFPQPFEGIKEALYYADAPCQNPSDITECMYDHGMSEDCLSVNIFEYEDGKKNKPVMVWFYGGAQLTGCNRGYTEFDFDGVNMITDNHDIVLVIANYRLGFLGSANLSVLDGYSDKYKYSNNLARLDTLLCLQWVKEYIEAFGGDPNNITAFGQSAGSNNITALMLMDCAKGAFNKAILEESFAVGGKLVSLRDSEIVSTELFKKLGVTTVEEALALPSVVILKAQAEMIKEIRTGDPKFAEVKSLALSPVIDNVVLFDDYWENLMSGKNCKDLKIMLGTNEGTFDDRMKMFGDFSKWEEALNLALRQESRNYSQETLNAYTKNYNRSAFNTARDLKNDSGMRVGAYVYANALSVLGEVYLYHFTYNDHTHSPSRAYHGIEIPVVFNNSSKARPEFVKAVQQAWLNFARTGNPNNEYLPVTWEKYTPENNNTMILDYDFRMVNGVKQKDIDLLIKYTREYQIPEFANICEMNKKQEE